MSGLSAVIDKQHWLKLQPHLMKDITNAYPAGQFIVLLHPWDTGTKKTTGMHFLTPNTPNCDSANLPKHDIH